MPLDFLIQESIPFSHWRLLRQIAGAETALNENDDKSDKVPQPFRWGWVAVVCLVVVVVSSQSGKNTVSSPIAETEVMASSASAGAETSPPIEGPVSEITLKTAARHVGLALGADGIDGATAYSVNCWAALERTFSLARAERCASFDALVLGYADVATQAMPQWFEEVAVLARYQSALTVNGANVGNIPNRLERLRVAAAIQIVEPVAPKIVSSVTTAATEGGINSSAAQDVMDSLAIDDTTATDE